MPAPASQYSILAEAYRRAFESAPVQQATTVAKGYDVRGYSRAVVFLPATGVCAVKWAHALADADPGAGAELSDGITAPAAGKATEIALKSAFLWVNNTGPTAVTIHFLA